MPEVSIIVPTYNRKELLKETLHAILAQTYRDFELIIVDNYSDYDFREHIKSFNSDKIRAFRNHNHGVIAVNRNFGIKQAMGKFIAFCDDDDVWYPEKLMCCLPYMGESDVIYHNFEIVGDNVPENQKIFYCRKISNENAYMDLLFNWNGMANSGVVVRKSILDKVGFFDEDKSLIGIEDFDMWLRIAKITNRFVLIPKVLGALYSGTTNFSKNIDKSIERDFILLEKYKSDISTAQYLRARSVINFCSGLRYINNDRKTANRYFTHVLFMKANFSVKIKALLFMVLGKSSFTLSNVINKLRFNNHKSP